MWLGILSDAAFGNWKFQHATISHIYHRRAGFSLNASLTHQFFDCVCKFWRDSSPNNQRFVISVHDALARRIWNDVHKLSEAHVVPSVDELFDLFFHGKIKPKKLIIVKQPDVSCGGSIVEWLR